MPHRTHRTLIALLSVMQLLIILPAKLHAQTAAARPTTQTTPISAAWKGPFFFIQMSDPQFGMYTSNSDFAKETENYEKAIAAANLLKPAFVIITGDLINKAGDPAQLAELKRINAKLDPSIPLRMLPGNHDLENIPTAATLATFRKEIGKDYYSWDIGGCHFIGINSTILMRPDVPDELDKQMNWIKDDLQSAAGAKPQHIVLFGHHPLFVTRPEEAETGNAIPSVRRKPMLEMLIANHSLYMFAGHLHRNAAGKSGDFQMVSTGPVGKPNGTDVSGFRIVKVYADRIEHEYVPLTQVPQRVELLDK